jgi:hypothetical protein
MKMANRTGHLLAYNSDCLLPRQFKCLIISPIMSVIGIKLNYLILMIKLKIELKQ